jgi:SAM-dependent methyltransferase
MANSRKAGHSRRSVMYATKKTRRTLNPKYLTPYHLQTQWAEITKLKEIIGEAYNALKHPLSVLDIGMGDARVPLWLSNVPTWNKIAKYVGMDISPYYVAESKRIINDSKFRNKVEVIQFDAVELDMHLAEFSKNRYDLVICTYFTAGDFKPNEIELKTKKDRSIADYDINVLKPNKAFVAVFKGAYDLLQEGGKVVIGSIYWDNDLARRIQEDLYKRCGMTIITSSKDLFTATKEGFWSERFDQHRIYGYLSWVPPRNIELIHLDDYNFAVMVIIRK